MAQISYGTITITDTNDIERIYVVYAKSANNATAPNITASNWKENIAEAPGSGNYIWQRTVVKKSGVSTPTYGDPVCVTGPQGSTGGAGRGISSVEIMYGTSANWSTRPTNWSDNVPAYNSATPKYWTRTKMYYDDNTSSETYNQDNGLTDAIAQSIEANTNAAAALSISQGAEEDAQGALSQTIDTQYQMGALDTRLKTFFWPGDSNYPGAYAVGKTETTGLNKEDISTYGYNLCLTPSSVTIGYNNIKVVQVDGSIPALKFYKPSTTTQGNLAMQLSSSALEFYGSSTTYPDVIVNGNGLSVYKGSSDAIASFGATTTIGKSNSKYIQISNNGLEIYDKSVYSLAIASINGDAIVLGRSGKDHISISPTNGLTIHKYDSNSQGSVPAARLGTDIIFGLDSADMQVKITSNKLQFLRDSGSTEGGYIAPISGGGMRISAGSYYNELQLCSGTGSSDGLILLSRAQEAVTISGNTGIQGTFECSGSIYTDRRFSSVYTYDNPSETITSTNLYVNSNGTFMKIKSSSQRYKCDIEDANLNIFNPHNLYNIPFRQFRYKPGYFGEEASNNAYERLYQGFIAEEVQEFYPFAAVIEENGEVETWSDRELIPPMLKLIQEQHEEIETLKVRINILEAK